MTTGASVPCAADAVVGMTPAGMVCRGCRSTDGEVVLDLGDQPAADFFPPVASAPPDPAYPLAMWWCARCGLAQLVQDAPDVQEPRAVEPQALVDQAAASMAAVAGAGLLPAGGSFAQCPSPHGGSWAAHARRHGLQEAAGDCADVLIDSFGIMHEPDQRAAAQDRARQLAPGGVLVLQFQNLGGIVRQRQASALRHGHFGYYSLAALDTLLAAAGLRVVRAWSFPLYGGTTLAVAMHAEHAPVVDPSVRQCVDAEARDGVDGDALHSLQAAADHERRSLRAALEGATAAGRRVFGYGAPSRAVAVLAGAGIDRSQLAAVADASPAKQGRRMPGTDIPIISPDELLAADPDAVALLLPDLRAEVERAHPRLAGRWLTPADDTTGGGTR